MRKRREAVQYFGHLDHAPGTTATGESGVKKGRSTFLLETPASHLKRAFADSGHGGVSESASVSCLMGKSTATESKSVHSSMALVTKAGAAALLCSAS